MLERREFIKSISLTAGAAALAPQLLAATEWLKPAVPAYLTDYSELYKKDPKKASLSWFRDAGYGLFMHYGLYSIWGRGAWVQYLEKIPVAAYVKLKNEFTAKDFDADYITNLALDSGMKYVNITTKHHDGFCLFKSAQTDYTSVHSAAKRDLTGELKTACDKKGLGLFLYYSVAADWHHPYFASNKDGWEMYRPPYEKPQPEYKYSTLKDFPKYIAYVKAQLKELITQYNPAGIWFDPAMGLYANASLFPMEEIYDHIRSLSPHVLISFKQGATGTEDFAAPERKANSLSDKVRTLYGDKAALLADRVWETHKNKHNETCSTMQRGAWSYEPENDGKRKHLGVEEVLELLKDAKSRNMNLLLNTGPLPDGSIHQGDADTLRKVGKLIKG